MRAKKLEGEYTEVTCFQSVRCAGEQTLTIDERNLTSTQWVEYHNETKRKSYNTLPTSDITAEAVTVGGFTLSQTDNAGRTLTVTDAAGNVTTTAYDPSHDLPATVTDAQGNTSCYRYDVRGHKVAEWGTGIQPVLFGYDDADRMVTLTTFRAGMETISTDPSEYTDGDVTSWPYHDTSGMEIRKSCADGSSITKTYDAENRPVSFNNAETNAVIECAYDHMGRRATKKVTVDGAITLHQRYLYRGYLQIACCDLTRSNHPALWLITWDPTQPIATRPLAIQKDGTWYTYGWDLTKNICELYGSNGYIRTAYTYTPYGEVTESANGVYQPIQWSSEFNDTELGLVYYNYRHYNPMDGRWLGRDSTKTEMQHNLMLYILNNPILLNDYLREQSIPRIDIESTPRNAANCHIHFQGEKYRYYSDSRFGYPGFYSKDGKRLPKELRKELAKKESDFARKLRHKISLFNKECSLAAMYGGGKISLSIVVLVFFADMPQSCKGYIKAIEHKSLRELDEAYYKMLDSIPEPPGSMSLMRSYIYTQTHSYHEEIKRKLKCDKE